MKPGCADATTTVGCAVTTKTVGCAVLPAGVEGGATGVAVAGRLLGSAVASVPPVRIVGAAGAAVGSRLAGPQAASVNKYKIARNQLRFITIPHSLFAIGYKTPQAAKQFRQSALVKSRNLIQLLSGYIRHSRIFRRIAHHQQQKRTLVSGPAENTIEELHGAGRVGQR